MTQRTRSTAIALATAVASLVLTVAVGDAPDRITLGLISVVAVLSYMMFRFGNDDRAE